MKTLNDPMQADEEPQRAEWSPARGLVRGGLSGLLAAVVLALLLGFIATTLPYLIVIVWLRAPLAFGVAWVLLQVVQRQAGMVDLRCLALSLALTVVVLVSNHVAFALTGVPDAHDVGDWWVFPMVVVEHIVPLRDGLLIGWQWLHPYALLATNLLPLLIGGGFCAAVADRS